jgi:hypothetical protein
MTNLMECFSLVVTPENRAVDRRDRVENNNDDDDGKVDDGDSENAQTKDGPVKNMPTNRSGFILFLLLVLQIVKGAGDK